MRMSGFLGIPPLRLEILRYLHQHPAGATSGEIARALGENIGYKTVLRHLQQLEGLNAIEAQKDDSQTRQGQHVIFVLNAETWDQAMIDIRRYVEGT